MPEAPSHRQEKPQKSNFSKNRTNLNNCTFFFLLYSPASSSWTSRAEPVTLAEDFVLTTAGRIPSCPRNTDSVNMRKRCRWELMDVLEVARQQCCKRPRRAASALLHLVAVPSRRLQEVPMVNYSKTEVEKNVSEFSEQTMCPL